jgi:penicillin-insensitive murein endopeptidase
MRRLVVLGALSAGLLISLTSHAAAGTKGRVSPSRSIGSPNEGHLVGGARIEGSKTLRVVGGNRWGLPDLVGLLERASKKVAEDHPGSVLTVGDLSKKGGGDVGGHHSHESGRDADLGFYLADGKGRQILPPRFATIDEEGRAKGMNRVRFDEARNWALVEALVTDPKGRVLQVFVANHLRLRLLAFAERQGVSQRVRDRAAELMLQPHHALPHDNHFHVRVACPKGEKDCVDYATKERKVLRRVARVTARSRGAHAVAHGAGVKGRRPK